MPGFLINRVSYGCCCGTLNEYTETTWSVDQAGYQPPALYSLVNVSSDAPVSLFGLNLTAGQLVTLRNVGTEPITLADESSGATSVTMRLDNPNDLSFVLEPGHTVTYRADNPLDATTGRVRLLSTTASVGSVTTQGDGTVMVGTAENTATIEGASSTFVEVIRDDTADVMRALLRASSTAADGPSETIARSRGTEAAPTVVTTGDTLFSQTFYAHDGTDFSTAARMLVKATGTIGANSTPGLIVWQTSPAGSQTPADRLSIGPDGGVTLGVDGYLSLDRHSGTPATPAAGQDVIFVDSTGVAKLLNSSGVASPLGGSTEGTLAAAGTNQGTAAALAAGRTEVTGASGTTGVILQNTTGGDFIVWNNAASALNVYPPTGGRLGTIGTNIADSIVAKGMKRYSRMSATQWTFIALASSV